MKKTVKINIIVNENIDDAISDILCWLEGYLAGGKQGYDYLLSPAIEKVRILNKELKEKLVIKQEDDNK